MRSKQVEAAVRASLLSLAWALGAGIPAMVAGVVAGSGALLGFGLNSVIDGSASAILVWRFRAERLNLDQAERVEHAAGRFIALALIVVSIYLTVRAFQSLAAGTGPSETRIGLYLAGASLVVLPTLAMWKLRLAAKLHSRALRGYGVLSSAGGLLAVITLLALVADGELGWWWSDAVGSLVIALVIGRRRPFSAPLSEATSRGALGLGDLPPRRFLAESNSPRPSPPQIPKDVSGWPTAQSRQAPRTGHSEQIAVAAFAL